MLDKPIRSPPTGAGVPIVTVPVELLPPMIDVGLTDNAISSGGLIVNFAELERPLRVPVTVAKVTAATELVLTANVA